MYSTILTCFTPNHNTMKVGKLSKLVFLKSNLTYILSKIYFIADLPKTYAVICKNLKAFSYKNSILMYNLPSYVKTTFFF